MIVPPTDNGVDDPGLITGCLQTIRLPLLTASRSEERLWLKRLSSKELRVRVLDAVFLDVRSC